SSRRRHTRSKRDWSSDVCSSDLNIGQWTSMAPLPFFPTAMHLLPTGKVMFFGGDPQGDPPGSPATTVMAWDPATGQAIGLAPPGDRKSTRLNSSHVSTSYAVFCL